MLKQILNTQPTTGCMPHMPTVSSVMTYWIIQQTSSHGLKHTVPVGSGSLAILTAVLLVTPVRAVAEAVTAEASDDAVDTILTGEECRGALRLDLSWEQGGGWGKQRKEEQRISLRAKEFSKFLISCLTIELFLAVKYKGAVPTSFVTLAKLLLLKCNRYSGIL